MIILETWCYVFSRILLLRTIPCIFYVKKAWKRFEWLSAQRIHRIKTYLHNQSLMSCQWKVWKVCCCPQSSSVMVPKEKHGPSSVLTGNTVTRKPCQSLEIHCKYSVPSRKPLAELHVPRRNIPNCLKRSYNYPLDSFTGIQYRGWGVQNSEIRKWELHIVWAFANWKRLLTVIDIY